MQLQIDRNKKERKSHGTYAFPVHVSNKWLSRYERRTFLWHWHVELEWTYIVEGEICYQIDDHTFHLKKGQGILCNSNMLHMGKAENDGDCHYVSVSVHPRLLGGFEKSFLEQKYVNRIVDNAALPCVLLDEKNEWQQGVLERLRRIESLYAESAEDYEFRIYLLLLECWLEVCRNLPEAEMDVEAEAESQAAARNTERLKTIFTYIHEHYAEKITLQDIAAQVNICSGECCRFFKKYMKESLFDYLLDYRIERSLKLLMEGTVTEAAEKVGFSSPAYYTKVFRERIGCTPREYKKREV